MAEGNPPLILERGEPVELPPTLVIQRTVDTAHPLEMQQRLVDWYSRRGGHIEMPLFEKIRTIAKEIYRANDATADKPVKDQLKTWEEMGFGKLPVCIAKTQYSFSTNPDTKGAPTDFSIPVREVRLSAGAEFVVAICGEIMTMPGLPKVPAADSIDVGADGKIVGLF